MSLLHAIISGCLVAVAAEMNNIVEAASADSNFTVLVEALQAADLVSTLQGTGPYTVFAPTDDAFAAALTALSMTKAELLARPDLADILKYHVLNGQITASALASTQDVATLATAEVNITASMDSDGGVTVTYGPTATVIVPDIMCSNGVIHMIDEVVLPPSSAKDIIVNANLTTTHTVLLEALETAGLVTTLQGAGPFTVFAPTDTAFTAALTDLSITKEQLLARPDLADILKFHVLNVKTMASALSATQNVATLACHCDVATLACCMEITKSSTTVMFGSATVTSADIECSNGVIHVIDKVVLPPSDFKDVVVNAQLTGNHTVLVEALTTANLVTTLQGTGPFTVFAPTDTAFDAALTDLSITKEELMERSDLADILKYHVLNVKTMASDLSATQNVDTLSTGRSVTITVSGGSVKFDTANVTQADIMARNGVIHVIDAVIVALPPASPTPSPSPSPSPSPTPTPTPTPGDTGNSNSSALTSGSPCVSSSWTVFIVGLLAVLMSLKIQ